MKSKTADRPRKAAKKAALPCARPNPNPDEDDALLLSLRHLRLPEVIRLLDCGERTWLRWVKNGNAPNPVRLGPGVVAWRVLDIQDWLAK